ncbi:MAG: alcohol dehydrogenase catalytic domain-containing protein [Melioribacteraceae bacterium]|nr:alcohol dehydrogenase catalytic domain-containing protein [Melioribacteraceae bacterium]MCF8353540.1 alcohol dehydrogenase catalytic domain-containing protein [Melioribacteraceae bacterium]MCF8392526.1 alcohol dehydrogenase catalytic domain-containing protein [Melioribacteraceae bacterium]MCF8418459.1 alcohol dehydrogenase catalytic domain-containing protein [Melioribacteraceae bacterium]
MKTIKLIGKGKFQVSDEEAPKLAGDNNALIKISSVGICGSDMHYFKEGGIGDQKVKFPFVIGHEAAGYVASISGKANIKEGDLVAIDPAVSCGKCDQCRANRKHTCRNLLFMGAPDQLNGLMCEFAIIPIENLFPVPANFTIPETVFIEPLSIGVYSVKLSNVSRNDDVLIFGAGPIGLSVVMTLSYHGIENVDMIEKLEYRLQLSKKIGVRSTAHFNNHIQMGKFADNNKLGYDVVFECSGDQAAIDSAVEFLKPGGKLILVGIPSETHIRFDISKLRRKEITVINVRRQNNSMEKAIEVMRQFKSKSNLILTHQFEYTKTQSAYDLVDNYEDEVIKAVVKF